MKTVIVGGGPTGLMAAVALAHRGIHSTVLETRTTPTDVMESRAITWMPRAVDVAEASGFRKELEAASSFRYQHSFTDRRGRRLAVVRFDRLNSPFPYTLQIPQGESERILEDVALRTGMVEIKRGYHVETIDQDKGGVTATGRHNGTVTTVHGDLGVAADGAKSLVRAQLGITTTRRDYGVSSVVADFVGTSGLPATESLIVLDPARPHGVFPITTDRWRLVYRVNDEEDRRQAATPHHASDVLASLPRAEATEWTWISAFRLAQENATTYRLGHWMLLGDAAHPMGPSAGAGMMLGILGAWRAAWAVAQSRHDSGALLAYSDQQRAAAARVQGSNARIFRQIALASGAFGALRSGVMPIAARFTPLERKMARQESLSDEPLPEI
jgi:2-polyprenyl-6-methoxyphenol hydroxylase-like FAD-dependent oxidoreductase